MELFWLGGEGSKDIPSCVYLHLMTELKLPAESLVKLRSVLKTGIYDSKPVTFFRIYNPDNEQFIQVKDFIYLDEHPELILYEGFWEKSNDRVHLEPKTSRKTNSR